MFNFKNFYIGIISSVLGQYLENLSEKLVEVQGFSGKFKAENLILKSSALNEISEQLSLPLQLKFGLIKKIELQLDWDSIFTSPCNLSIIDIHILCNPQHNMDFEYIKLKNSINFDKYIENKFLAIIQKIGNNFFDLNENDFIANMSYTSKLISSIKVNLNLSVDNIHLRIEEDYMSKKFNLGLCIRTIEIYPCSKTGINEFKDLNTRITEGKSFRKIEIGGLCVYHNSNKRVYNSNDIRNRNSKKVINFFDNYDPKNLINFILGDNLLPPLYEHYYNFSSKFLNMESDEYHNQNCVIERVDFEIKERRNYDSEAKNIDSIKNGKRLEATTNIVKNENADKEASSSYFIDFNKKINVKIDDSLIYDLLYISNLKKFHNTVFSRIISSNNKDNTIFKNEIKIRNVIDLNKKEFLNKQQFKEIEYLSIFRKGFCDKNTNNHNFSSNASTISSNIEPNNTKLLYLKNIIEYNIYILKNNINKERDISKKDNKNNIDKFVHPFSKNQLETTLLNIQLFKELYYLYLLNNNSYSIKKLSNNELLFSKLLKTKFPSKFDLKKKLFEIQTLLDTKLVLLLRCKLYLKFREWIEKDYASITKTNINNSSKAYDEFFSSNSNTERKERNDGKKKTLLGGFFGLFKKNNNDNSNIISISNNSNFGNIGNDDGITSSKIISEIENNTNENNIDNDRNMSKQIGIDEKDDYSVTTQITNTTNSNTIVTNNDNNIINSNINSIADKNQKYSIHKMIDNLLNKNSTNDSLPINKTQSESSLITLKIEEINLQFKVSLSKDNLKHYSNKDNNNNSDLSSNFINNNNFIKEKSNSVFEILMKSIVYQTSNNSTKEVQYKKNFILLDELNIKYIENNDENTKTQLLFSSINTDTSNDNKKNDYTNNKIISKFFSSSSQELKFDIDGFVKEIKEEEFNTLENHYLKVLVEKVIYNYNSDKNINQTNDSNTDEYKLFKFFESIESTSKILVDMKSFDLFVDSKVLSVIWSLKNEVNLENKEYSKNLFHRGVSADNDIHIDEYVNVSNKNECINNHRNDNYIDDNYETVKPILEKYVNKRILTPDYIMIKILSPQIFFLFSNYTSNTTLNNININNNNNSNNKQHYAITTNSAFLLQLNTILIKTLPSSSNKQGIHLLPHYSTTKPKIELYIIGIKLKYVNNIFKYFSSSVELTENDTILISLNNIHIIKELRRTKTTNENSNDDAFTDNFTIEINEKSTNTNTYTSQSNNFLDKNFFTVNLNNQILCKIISMIEFMKEMKNYHSINTNTPMSTINNETNIDNKSSDNAKIRETHFDKNKSNNEEKLSVKMKSYLSCIDTDIIKSNHNLLFKTLNKGSFKDKENILKSCQEKSETNDNVNNTSQVSDNNNEEEEFNSIDEEFQDAQEMIDSDCFKNNNDNRKLTSNLIEYTKQQIDFKISSSNFNITVYNLLLFFDTKNIISVDEVIDNIKIYSSEYNINSKSNDLFKYKNSMFVTFDELSFNNSIYFRRYLDKELNNNNIYEDTKDTYDICIKEVCLKNIGLRDITQFIYDDILSKSIIKTNQNDNKEKNSNSSEINNKISLTIISEVKREYNNYNNKETFLLFDISSFNNLITIEKLRLITRIGLEFISISEIKRMIERYNNKKDNKDNKDSNNSNNSTDNSKNDISKFGNKRKNISGSINITNLKIEYSLQLYKAFAQNKLNYITCSNNKDIKTTKPTIINDYNISTYNYYQYNDHEKEFEYNKEESESEESKDDIGVSYQQNYSTTKKQNVIYNRNKDNRNNRYNRNYINNSDDPISSIIGYYSNYYNKDKAGESGELNNTINNKNHFEYCRNTLRTDTSGGFIFNFESCFERVCYDDNNNDDLSKSNSIVSKTEIVINKLDIREELLGLIIKINSDMCLNNKSSIIKNNNNHNNNYLSDDKETQQTYYSQEYDLLVDQIYISFNQNVIKLQKEIYFLSQKFKLIKDNVNNIINSNVTNENSISSDNKNITNNDMISFPIFYSIHIRNFNTNIIIFREICFNFNINSITFQSNILDYNINKTNNKHNKCSSININKAYSVIKQYYKKEILEMKQAYMSIALLHPKQSQTNISLSLLQKQLQINNSFNSNTNISIINQSFLSITDIIIHRSTIHNLQKQNLSVNKININIHPKYFELLKYLNKVKNLVKETKQETMFQFSKNILTTNTFNVHSNYTKQNTNNTIDNNINNINNTPIYINNLLVKSDLNDLLISFLGEKCYHYSRNNYRLILKEKPKHSLPNNNLLHKNNLKNNKSKKIEKTYTVERKVEINEIVASLLEYVKETKELRYTIASNLKKIVSVEIKNIEFIESFGFISTKITCFEDSIIDYLNNYKENKDYNDYKYDNVAENTIRDSISNRNCIEINDTFCLIDGNIDDSNNNNDSCIDNKNSESLLLLEFNEIKELYDQINSNSSVNANILIIMINNNNKNNLNNYGNSSNNKNSEIENDTFLDSLIKIKKDIIFSLDMEVKILNDNYFIKSSNNSSYSSSNNKCYNTKSFFNDKSKSNEPIVNNKSNDNKNMTSSIKIDDNLNNLNKLSGLISPNISNTNLNLSNPNKLNVFDNLGNAGNTNNGLNSNKNYLKTITIKLDNDSDLKNYTDLTTKSTSLSINSHHLNIIFSLDLIIVLKQILKYKNKYDRIDKYIKDYNAIIDTDKKQKGIFTNYLEINNSLENQNRKKKLLFNDLINIDKINISLIDFNLIYVNNNNLFDIIVKQSINFKFDLEINIFKKSYLSVLSNNKRRESNSNSNTKKSKICSDKSKRVSSYQEGVDIGGDDKANEDVVESNNNLLNSTKGFGINDNNDINYNDHNYTNKDSDDLTYEFDISINGIQLFITQNKQTSSNCHDINRTENSYTNINNTKSEIKFNSNTKYGSNIDNRLTSLQYYHQKNQVIYPFTINITSNRNNKHNDYLNIENKIIFNKTNNKNNVIINSLSDIANIDEFLTNNNHINNNANTILISIHDIEIDVSANKLSLFKALNTYLLEMKAAITKSQISQVLEYRNNKVNYIINNMNSNNTANTSNSTNPIRIFLRQLKQKLLKNKNFLIAMNSFIIVFAKEDINNLKYYEPILFLIVEKFKGKVQLSSLLSKYNEENENGNKFNNDKSISIITKIETLKLEYFNNFNDSWEPLIEKFKMSNLISRNRYSNTTVIELSFSKGLNINFTVQMIKGIKLLIDDFKNIGNYVKDNIELLAFGKKLDKDIGKNFNIDRYAEYHNINNDTNTNNNELNYDYITNNSSTSLNYQLLIENNLGEDLYLLVLNNSILKIGSNKLVPVDKAILMPKKNFSSKFNNRSTHTLDNQSVVSGVSTQTDFKSVIHEKYRSQIDRINIATLNIKFISFHLSSSKSNSFTVNLSKKFQELNVKNSIYFSNTISNISNMNNLPNSNNKIIFDTNANTHSNIASKANKDTVCKRKNSRNNCISIINNSTSKNEISNNNINSKTAKRKESNNTTYTLLNTNNTINNTNHDKTNKLPEKSNKQYTVYTDNRSIISTSEINNTTHINNVFDRFSNSKINSLINNETNETIEEQQQKKLLRFFSNIHIDSFGRKVISLNSPITITNNLKNIILIIEFFYVCSKCKLKCENKKDFFFDCDTMNSDINSNNIEKANYCIGCISEYKRKIKNNHTSNCNISNNINMIISPTTYTMTLQPNSWKYLPIKYLHYSGIRVKPILLSKADKNTNANNINNTFNTNLDSNEDNKSNYLYSNMIVDYERKSKGELLYCSSTNGSINNNSNSNSILNSMLLVLTSHVNLAEINIHYNINFDFPIEIINQLPTPILLASVLISSENKINNNFNKNKVNEEIGLLSIDPFTKNYSFNPKFYKLEENKYTNSNSTDRYEQNILMLNRTLKLSLSEVIQYLKNNNSNSNDNYATIESNNNINDPQNNQDTPKIELPENKEIVNKYFLEVLFNFDYHKYNQDTVYSFSYNSKSSVNTMLSTSNDSISETIKLIFSINNKKLSLIFYVDFILINETKYLTEIDFSKNSGYSNNKSNKLILDSKEQVLLKKHNQIKTITNDNNNTTNNVKSNNTASYYKKLKLKNDIRKLFSKYDSLKLLTSLLDKRKNSVEDDLISQTVTYKSKTYLNNNTYNNNNDTMSNYLSQNNNNIIINNLPNLPFNINLNIEVLLNSCVLSQLLNFTTSNSLTTSNNNVRYKNNTSNNNESHINNDIMNMLNEENVVSDSSFQKLKLSNDGFKVFNKHKALMKELFEVSKYDLSIEELRCYLMIIGKKSFSSSNTNNVNYFSVLNSSNIKGNYDNEFSRFNNDNVVVKYNSIEYCLEIYELKEAPMDKSKINNKNKSEVNNKTSDGAYNILEKNNKSNNNDNYNIIDNKNEIAVDNSSLDNISQQAEYSKQEASNISINLMNDKLKCFDIFESKFLSYMTSETVCFHSTNLISSLEAYNNLTYYSKSYSNNLIDNISGYLNQLNNSQNKKSKAYNSTQLLSEIQVALFNQDFTSTSKKEKCELKNRIINLDFDIDNSKKQLFVLNYSLKEYLSIIDSEFNINNNNNNSTKNGSIIKNSNIISDTNTSNNNYYFSNIYDDNLKKNQNNNANFTLEVRRIKDFSLSTIDPLQFTKILSIQDKYLLHNLSQHEIFISQGKHSSQEFFVLHSNKKSSINWIKDNDKNFTINNNSNKFIQIKLNDSYYSESFSINRIGEFYINVKLKDTRDIIKRNKNNNNDKFNKYLVNNQINENEELAEENNNLSNNSNNNNNEDVYYNNLNIKNNQILENTNSQYITTTNIIIKVSIFEIQGQTNIYFEDQTLDPPIMIENYSSEQIILKEYMNINYINSSSSKQAKENNTQQYFEILMNKNRSQTSQYCAFYKLNRLEFLPFSMLDIMNNDIFIYKISSKNNSIEEEFTIMNEIIKEEKKKRFKNKRLLENINTVKININDLEEMLELNSKSVFSNNSKKEDNDDNNRRNMKEGDKLNEEGNIINSEANFSSLNFKTEKNKIKLEDLEKKLKALLENKTITITLSKNESMNYVLKIYNSEITMYNNGILFRNSYFNNIEMISNNNSITNSYKKFEIKDENKINELHNIYTNPYNYNIDILQYINIKNNILSYTITNNDETEHDYNKAITTLLQSKNNSNNQNNTAINSTIPSTLKSNDKENNNNKKNSTNIYTINSYANPPIEKNDKLIIKIDFTFLGVSLIDQIPKELAYLNIESPVIDVKIVNKKLFYIDLFTKSLQIDNSLHNSYYNVFFKMKDHLLLSLSYIQNDIGNVLFVKNLSFEIGKLIMQVDGVLIFEIVTMINTLKNIYNENRNKRNEPNSFENDNYKGTYYNDKMINELYKEKNKEIDYASDINNLDTNINIEEGNLTLRSGNNISSGIRKSSEAKSDQEKQNTEVNLNTLSNNLVHKNNCSNVRVANNNNTNTVIKTMNPLLNKSNNISNLPSFKQQYQSITPQNYKNNSNLIKNLSFTFKKQNNLNTINTTINNTSNNLTFNNSNFAKLQLLPYNDNIENSHFHNLKNKQQQSNKPKIKIIIEKAFISKLDITLSFKPSYKLLNLLVNKRQQFFYIFSSIENMNLYFIEFKSTNSQAIETILSLLSKQFMSQNKQIITKYLISSSILLNFTSIYSNFKQVIDTLVQSVLILNSNNVFSYDNSFIQENYYQYVRDINYREDDILRFIKFALKHILQLFALLVYGINDSFQRFFTLLKDANLLKYKNIRYQLNSNIHCIKNKYSKTNGDYGLYNGEMLSSFYDNIDQYAWGYLNNILISSGLFKYQNFNEILMSKFFIGNAIIDYTNLSSDKDFVIKVSKYSQHHYNYLLNNIYEDEEQSNNEVDFNNIINNTKTNEESSKRAYKINSIVNKKNLFKCNLLLPKCEFIYNKDKDDYDNSKSNITHNKNKKLSILKYKTLNYIINGVKKTDSNQLFLIYFSKYKLQQGNSKYQSLISSIKSGSIFIMTLLYLPFSLIISCNIFIKEILHKKFNIKKDLIKTRPRRYINNHTGKIEDYNLIKAIALNSIQNGFYLGNNTIQRSEILETDKHTSLKNEKMNLRQVIDSLFNSKLKSNKRMIFENLNCNLYEDIDTYYELKESGELVIITKFKILYFPKVFSNNRNKKLIKNNKNTNQTNNYIYRKNKSALSFNYFSSPSILSLISNEKLDSIDNKNTVNKIVSHNQINNQENNILNDKDKEKINGKNNDWNMTSINNYSNNDIGLVDSLFNGNDSIEIESIKIENIYCYNLMSMIDKLSLFIFYYEGLSEDCLLNYNNINEEIDNFSIYDIEKPISAIPPYSYDKRSIYNRDLRNKMYNDLILKDREIENEAEIVSSTVKDRLEYSRKRAESEVDYLKYDYSAFNKLASKNKSNLRIKSLKLEAEEKTSKKILTSIYHTLKIKIPNKNKDLNN